MQSNGAQARESLRRPRDLLRRDEISQCWGLALVAIFVAGLLLVGVAGARSHAELLRQERLMSRLQAVQYAAEQASHMPSDSPAAMNVSLADLAAQYGLEYCVFVDAQGQVLASAEPTEVGQRWALADRIPLAPTLVTHGPPRQTNVNGEEIIALSAPVTDEMNSTHGAVHAGYSTADLGLSAALLSRSLGPPALVSLALLLGAYHFFRRSMRPLSRVRDRLLSLPETGLATQLHELGIDGLPSPVTNAWNRLIDLAEELRSAVCAEDSRKRLAEALSSRDAGQVRELIDWMPDGVLLVDEFGQVSLINRACRTLALAATDDPVGKPATGLSRDGELNEVIARLTSAQSRNQRVTVYHTLEHAGISTTLAITVVHPASEKGPRGTMLVLHDASQQKQAEKARDEFLHQMTHEFRTPLSNIRAYTETLMEDILEDRDAQRECLNVINSEARRLGRLVEEVLTASQLEVGTARLRLSLVDFAKLLSQSVLDQQATADEKGIELSLKLPPKVPKIQGDKDRLAVVMNNLLGNAIKYSPKGASVKVECETQGRHMVVSVSDTGMGIAAEELDKVFEKFYRSQSEDVQNIPGTGLGLATARQIVRLHGGDIAVTSAPGQGSTFTVTLPVYEVGEVTRTGARAQEAVGTGAE